MYITVNKNALKSAIQELFPNRIIGKKDRVRVYTESNERLRIFNDNFECWIYCNSIQPGRVVTYAYYLVNALDMVKSDSIEARFDGEQLILEHKDGMVRLKGEFPRGLDSDVDQLELFGLGTEKRISQGEITAQAHYQAIESIVESAILSVVTVVCTSQSSGEDDFIHYGSGLIVTPNGLVATNYHVIEKSKSISVQFSLEEKCTASPVCLVPEDDLALIQIPGRGFRSLLFEDMRNIKIGQEVIAIGTPVALMHTVTKGIVSGIRKWENLTYIQTDAAINKGNSGGPLLNGAGRVVGINTFMYKKDIAEGLNFAISAGDVKRAFQKYLV